MARRNPFANVKRGKAIFDEPVGLEDAVAVKRPSRARKFKHGVSITVDTTPRLGSVDPESSGWRKEESKRLQSEIDAIQRELDTFDSVKTANKVKAALSLRLRLKKLRLQEHNLRITPMY